MKNKNLAQRLKELRKRKGLSQEELSDNSGLSLRTIQRIENGETEPTGDTLKKISNTLDVTPDELIDWTIKEDRSYLKALNFSALTFLFFPLLGIIVPLIMWLSKKDKLKDINKIGKDIINFEITWTILCFLGFIIITIFMAQDWNPYEEDSVNILTSILRSNLLFQAIMYTFNFVTIIFNAFLINMKKDVKYYPKVRFLRK